MAQSRYLSTRFWKDNWVADLNSSDKLLFIYLITNQNTNIAGMYEITLREIAMDTGIDKDMIEKQLANFQAAGKVYYIEGHIIVRNFINHQAASPKIQQGIATIIENLPERLRKFITLDDAGLWLDVGENPHDLTLLTPKINEMWLKRIKDLQQSGKARKPYTNYNKQQGRGL